MIKLDKNEQTARLCVQCRIQLSNCCKHIIPTLPGVCVFACVWYMSSVTDVTAME